MFNKKFFLIATGYIAGGLVSSLYNKKKSKDLKTELKDGKKNWGWEFKVLLANFLDTHKNFLSDIEKEMLSDKNKALFNAKKSLVLKTVDEYKLEGNKIFEELQVQGKSYFAEASNELKKLYEEKKSELESVEEISPDKISEIKNNLLGVYEEIKTKIQEKCKK